MTQRRSAKRRHLAGPLATAAAVGLLVHLLLFTAGKDDSDPPVCHSLIGYDVPCGNLSYAAGSISACVVAGRLLRGTARRPDDAAEPRDPATGTHASCR